MCWIHRWYFHVYATSFFFPSSILCTSANLSQRVYMCRSQRVSTLNVLERKKNIHAQFSFLLNCVHERVLSIFFSCWFLRDSAMKLKLIAQLWNNLLYTSAEHMRMQICNTFNDENYSFLYEICGRLHSMHSYLINMGHDFSKKKSSCNLYISQSII